MEWKLRRIRLKKGLSQLQLAKLSGLNVSTIKEIEQNNDKNVLFSTLLGLTKALKVNPDDIIEF